MVIVCNLKKDLNEDQKRIVRCKLYHADFLWGPEKFENFPSNSSECKSKYFAKVMNSLCILCEKYLLLRMKWVLYTEKNIFFKEDDQM